MGHQLNIKNAEASRMAAELAALTGESVTSVVTAAIREKLAREQEARATDQQARVDRLLALAAEVRAALPRPLPTSSTDWMYDEDGLPK